MFTANRNLMLGQKNRVDRI